MNIYQFQNLLYIKYIVKTRLDNKFLYIENNESNSNVVKRAIGEEINDFLKENWDKEYIIYPWLKSFDNWRYNNV